MKNVKNLVKDVFPGLIPIVRRTKITMQKFRHPEPVFTEIYKKNAWGDAESVSGPGSNLAQSKIIRAELPGLMRELGARTVMDIPCGDYYWMREVQLDVDRYVGADVVEDLVEDNRRRYGNNKTEFVRLDITRDKLPQVDMVICRDLLVHFNYRHILRSIQNIKKSESKYLLTTTFVGHDKNEDIITGEWRPINLVKLPFNFPDPIKIIDENYAIGRSRKSLGLWKISDLLY
jgi:hypothetical protein